MNEHSGFHEYKDSKRFNPECLVCLAEDRDLKKGLFEIELRSLIRLRERQVMFIGSDEGRLKLLPHLRQFYKRMCNDFNLFRGLIK